MGNTLDQYEVDGFKNFKHSDIKNMVLNLREQIISVFNNASLAGGSGEFLNDGDICKLYIENKPAWIAGYDNIRLLPELYSFAGSTIIIGYLKRMRGFTTCISFPQHCSQTRYVCR
jgi:hypothetical protein